MGRWEVFGRLCFPRDGGALQEARIITPDILYLETTGSVVEKSHQRDEGLGGFLGQDDLERDHSLPWVVRSTRHPESGKQQRGGGSGGQGSSPCPGRSDSKASGLVGLFSGSSGKLRLLAEAFFALEAKLD